METSWKSHPTPGAARGQTASWRRRVAGADIARMRSSVVVCVARSPRRLGINGSISGREGGALAATTASGSHYHRRQRLHHRRLDSSPPRRLLRPHPVPYSRSPWGPEPGNPRLPFSVEKLIVKPGRPGLKSRPCHHLIARCFPLSEPVSCEAAGETGCIGGFVNPDLHPVRAAPTPAPQGVGSRRPASVLPIGRCRARWCRLAENHSPRPLRH